MKQFSCGAVIPNCDAQFEEDSEERILDAVRRHAAADHGQATLSLELVETVRKHIHDRVAS